MESSGSEIAGGRRRQRVVEAMRPLTEIFELNRRLPVWRPTQRPRAICQSLARFNPAVIFRSRAHSRYNVWRNWV